ncbi:Tetratricopeptide TPR_1 repeat-containing protein [Methanofollis liminatans DSM 4140]|uniref:Tetratricopeptide TPR_1 repeat-containing protein n=1 Tax=Methanofollis liminatans DSM 4140 TaxID=28892 RepID=J1AQJ2_9EURY|nr:tetratricopeptide repeat protein [Methanofollis liminatans]EJG07248.1 Tetratricopeptide TPR_1 repeat-containing protein [Methanofollis liminatans DSM 4140]
MTINISPVRDFLWESYAVRADREFLCSVQDLSHEEKRDRFIDHALDNLMLVRLKRDPGFAKYVLERVRESPAVLERVRQTILLIFGETAKIAYSDPDLPGPKGLFEVMERAVENGGNPLEEVMQFSQNPSLVSSYTSDRIRRERESKLRYLQARLEAAEGEVENDLEILAIRRQMSDQGSGLYYGPGMGVDDTLFPAAGSTADIFHAANRFVVQNLRFRGRFSASGDPQLPDQSLMECVGLNLPFQAILERALFGRSVADPHPDVEAARELWKFETDSATITAYEWFLSLSHDEKVRVLNGNYPFSIGEQYLSDLAQCSPEAHLHLVQMTRLFYAGFYEHAAKVGEYLFSREKKGKEKYVLADDIATAYREYEDYRSALKWYEIALKLTKKLEPGMRQHKEFVERKNCAEMRHHLGNCEQFRREVARIAADAGHFPAEIRGSVEYNLAEACRRTGEYALEYEHLTEYMPLADPDDPHLRVALERLEIFALTLDEPDFRTIRGIELREREEKYRQRLKTAMLSFQYGDAMHWIDRLLAVRPTPERYTEKSTLCRHFGRSVEAIDLLQKAAELSHEDSYTKVFSWISLALLKAHTSGDVDGEVSGAIRLALRSAGIRGRKLPGYDYIEVIKPIIYETVGWGDPGLSARFLEEFAGEFSALGLPGDPARFIGEAYLQDSLSEEARVWLQEAAGREGAGPERAAVFTLIAGSYVVEGDPREACEWYARAVEDDPVLSVAYAGMAQCHAALMEYERALTALKRARDLDPENTDYRKMEEEIAGLAAHVIALPRINSEEVRSVFRTGDWLLYSVFTGPERASYDIGPVVVQYGKGVEKMLYEEVLRPVRERIRQDERFCPAPGSGVEGRFWDGSKKVPALPFTLKAVLGNAEKSLSLGQWANQVSDIRNRVHNPVTRAFRDLMEERGYSEEVIGRIGDLCRTLSLERNGAAHISFYSRDEVMEKRGEMVGVINEVIGIVYGRGG